MHMLCKVQNIVPNKLTFFAQNTLHPLVLICIINF